jgi:hypothetical protein
MGGTPAMEVTTKGTGKWCQPGVPHKGWTCFDIEDLEEPSAICEMCETQEIRYVHHMEHRDYPGHLAVGCICAGRMEENYEAAHRRELAVRSAASRKRRWLSRIWRVSSKGNSYINVDGYNIVAFPHVSGGHQQTWGFRVTNRKTDDSLQSRRPYISEDAARLRAFDAMIWMKERGR